MKDFLEIARQYHRAGFHVIPIDSNKRPTNLLAPNYGWIQYTESQSEEEIELLFKNPSYGIAVITGVNGLEVLDVDCKYDLTGTLWTDYISLIESWGKNLFDYTVAKTKNNGYHLFFKCEKNERNQKLASRPATEKELADKRKITEDHNKKLEEDQAEGKRTNERKQNIITDPNRMPSVLLETRGEKGYVAVYPTEGYEIIGGRMATIPQVTVNERKMILDAARVFNGVVDVNDTPKIEKVVRNEKRKANTDQKSPWDDYNEKTDLLTLVESYGWTNERTVGNDKILLKRPGTKNPWSGDIWYHNNTFRSYSTSTVFEPYKPYSAAAFYTMMQHGGDFSSAAKDLYHQGFGDRWKPEDNKPEVEKEEITIDDLDAELEARKYSIEKKPEDLDFVLNMNVEDRVYPVASFGMMGIITGIAKSRKSTFLSALVASGLSGGDEKININLDLRGKRALFVDTEQPEQYFYSAQTKTHYLSGHSKNHPNYSAYCLRDFSVEKRLIAIERLFEKYNDLGLVVLDGALDLVRSFNDEGECQAIVQKMMEWTKQTGAMIITVVHKNRSSDWMQGHLGSMLEKKCDFAFEMAYDSDDGFTTVKHKLSRSAPFPPYQFTQDEHGYPIMNHNERPRTVDPKLTGLGGGHQAPVSVVTESIFIPESTPQTNFNTHKPDPNTDIPF